MDQRKMERLDCPLGNAKLDCFLIEPGVARGSVVICPGGGYEFCSTREADPVAAAFNRAGYHAFVLWYDCAEPPLGLEPVRQLAWAVAELRRNAAKWGLHPGKIAVCGFSAGGHLAGTLGALWSNDDLFTASKAEERRPNALILSYPVVTAGKYANRRSFVNLAGADAAAQQKFSLETMVTEQMPPTFLWHTMDDEEVPVQNALLLCRALMGAGIPHELHLFQHGVHGLSLATADTSDVANGRVPDAHVAKWFVLASEWLASTFAAGVRD
ncbi:MAG: alpha/beta hydrolase [Intestinibacillus sp.]